MNQYTQIWSYATKLKTCIFKELLFDQDKYANVVNIFNNLIIFMYSYKRSESTLRKLVNHVQGF